MENNREVTVIYKGVQIKYVRGSNWAYVGKEVFQSVLGAKQAITRRLNKGKKVKTYIEEINQEFGVNNEKY